MNEPKKRGRPSKADIEARAKPEVTHNGDEHYIPQPKEEPMQVPVLLQPSADDELKAKAQAYAMRVWAGQSESLGRGTRVARVKLALEGQGMSMDGVKLPGDDGSTDDGEEWTSADMAPVTFRYSR